jgi:hypothetical protein
MTITINPLRAYSIGKKFGLHMEFMGTEVPTSEAPVGGLADSHPAAETFQRIANEISTISFTQIPFYVVFTAKKTDESLVELHL